MDWPFACERTWRLRQRPVYAARKNRARKKDRRRTTAPLPTSYRTSLSTFCAGSTKMGTPPTQSQNGLADALLFSERNHAVNHPRRAPPLHCPVGVGALARSRIDRGTQGARTGETRPQTLDHLARRRLARPAAALQGGAGVSQF